MDPETNTKNNKNEEKEWDEDSDSESVSSEGDAGGLKLPRNKKHHRADAFLKRKKEDLGSSSSGRGASAKKVARRPVSERSAGASGGDGGAAHLSSSEEEASAIGSDQERKADFEKTVESAFRQVALKRKKASRDGAIEAATASITAAAVSNFGRAPMSELAKLQQEVARLTAALESLLAENRSLRADLNKMREQDAGRGGAARQQAQTVPADNQILALVRQEMAAFQARFSVLEGRVLRPPLAAAKPLAAQRASYAAAASAAPPPRRGPPSRPPVTAPNGPTRRAAAQSKPKTATAVQVQRAPVLTSAPVPSSAPVAKRPPKPTPSAAPTSSATEFEWQVVGENKKRRRAAKAAKKKAQKQRRRQRAAAAQLRAPNKTAAVVVTLQPDAVKRGVSYRDVLAQAKEAMNLQELGITSGLRLRVTATGARMLEVPGAGSGPAADALAERLRASISADDALT